MVIKFNLKLTVENSLNGDLIDFSKIVTRTIELQEGDTVELYKKNITDYFEKNINEYCTKNNILKSDLIIDGYEVISKTTNIHVYFKSDDIKVFSLEPSIMAYHKEVTNVIPLNCEQIDENTIRWYWEEGANDVVAHYLIDVESDTIVAHLPVMVDYYLESNLTPGKTYSRKLVSYDDTGLKTESLICSITLGKEDKISTYTNFQVEKRNEDIQEYNDVLCDRLEAFSSGIGDNLDCKLFKSDDIAYSKKFKLINKIYGVRASNEVKHHAIKFKYRFKMVGKVNYPTYDGSVKVSLKATEVTQIGVKPIQELNSTIESERTLEYVFNENCNVADICVSDLIPELKKSYGTRYRFDIEIKNVNSNIRIYSHVHGGRKEVENNSTVIKFSEYGFYDTKIHIVSEPIIKQKEYVEIYPPYQYEPLVGVVNGDFETSTSGKKDMTDNAPVFSFPDSVYDVKYYCVLEEVLPTDSYVTYKFSNDTGNDGYTLTNGDKITFTSNSIIEDPTEYEDFIAQIEQGDYIINDSRKHTYRYTISDISVNIDKYKRFILKVSPNTNDITILNHTTDLIVNDDGNINTAIEVQTRAIQSAIAKWNPLIHNGYYYYNNEERYLYTNCIMDGEGKKIEDVYYSPTVSVKVSVEATEPTGPIESFDITLSSKADLLLDENLFFYKNNKIYPRPTNVPNDYYCDLLEKYTYFSKPIVFPKKATEYNSFSWTETCKAGNKIDVYVISFNDVYGTWNKPVKVTNGGAIPSELKKSNIIKFKIVLTPAFSPTAATRDLLFSSEGAWDNICEKNLTTNVISSNERLEPKSFNTRGVYISKVFDLGDTSAAHKVRQIQPMLKYTGEVKFYIQESNKLEMLDNRLNSSAWIEVDNNTARPNVKRFYRFKIEISPRSSIHNAVIKTTRYEYADMGLDNVLPSFGNLNVKAKYDPAVSSRKYENIITKVLPFDEEEYTLIDNLKSFITTMARSQGFIYDNITSFTIIPYGSMQEKFTVSYNNTEITSGKVLIKSIETTYDEDLIKKHHKGVIFNITDNKFETYPIPQQYSPIIINEIKNNDEMKNSLTQVFFTDENGDYTLYNTEIFESLGFKTLYLQYDNIDITSLNIEIDGQKMTNYSIINNIVQFEEEIYEGAIVDIKYKLNSSFCVNYDYVEDKAIISLNGDNGKEIKKIRAFYETNKSSSTRKLHDISLNPIYNAAYNGYIYICDYTLKPNKVRIYPATDMVFANGLDEIGVLIKITDKNDNPLPNMSANIASQYGSIRKVTEKSDVNGILKCIYTSATIGCKDKITVSITPSVRDMAVITNRKL